MLYDVVSHFRVIVPLSCPGARDTCCIETVTLFTSMVTLKLRPIVAAFNRSTLTSTSWPTATELGGVLTDTNLTTGWITVMMIVCV